MTRTQTLPAILAVVDTYDSGEFGNANCPHCGAQGRYVHTFVCEDGTRHSAMSGCIKLFPESKGGYARLTKEALQRSVQANVEGKRLASWWSDMIDALRLLSSKEIDANEFKSRVDSAERSRQQWLARNGYSRFNRRRR